MLSFVSAVCLHQVIIMICWVGVHVAVPRMRAIVAQQADESTMDAYKSYFAAGVDGYAFMSKIDFVEQLRERLSVSLL